MIHLRSRAGASALILAAIAAVAGVVVALPGGPGEQAARPGAAAVGDDARVLLEQSAEAYRSAAALTDVMTVEMTASGMPPQNFELEYGFGAGADSFVRLPGLSATAIDGRVFVTRDDVPGRYLDVPLRDDLATTLTDLFGGNPNLPVQFDMRAGRGVDAYLPAMGLGMIESAQVTGVESTKSPSGDTLRVLNLTGANGRGQVMIDPTTKLLRGMTIEATMPSPSGPMQLAATVRLAPRLRTAAETVVAFDPAGRSAVDSMQALAPRAVAVGDPAPDFTLEGLDGTPITLADLRGTVVVLDFWATWCGPCKRALPFLQQFDDWAKGSGQPVKVFAVNTMERAPTPEAIRTKATAYWTGQKYTLANLFDLDSAVVQSYGIQGIPTTIVIGRDGVVTSVHNGFRPDMVATLQKDVEAALE